MNKTFTVTRTVTEDAIDNNNHMHDAYYNIILARSLINSMRFMVYHGQRDRLQYTVLLLKHTLLFT